MDCSAHCSRTRWKRVCGVHRRLANLRRKKESPRSVVLEGHQPFGCGKVSRVRRVGEYKVLDLPVHKSEQDQQRILHSVSVFFRTVEMSIQRFSSGQEDITGLGPRQGKTLFISMMPSWRVIRETQKGYPKESATKPSANWKLKSGSSGCLSAERRVLCSR